MPADVILHNARIATNRAPRTSDARGGRLASPATGPRGRWEPSRHDTCEEGVVMPAPVIIVTGVSRGIGSDYPPRTRRGTA